MRGVMVLALTGTLFVPCVIPDVIKDMVKSEDIRGCSGEKGQRVSVWYNGPAKMSNVLGSIWEHVIVPCPSPKIETFVSFLNVNKVLGADCGPRMRCEAALSRAFGTYESSPRLIVLGESKIEGHRIVAQFAVGPEPQIARRGIPTILPYWPESPIVVSGTVRLPESGKAICENEGLSICDKRFPCQIGLSGGGSPKGGGECGNDHSGQRGDRPVVRVYEATGALNIGAGRARESGWVFFGGAAGVLCLMLGQALLEAWRKKPLTRNKGTKED